MRKGVRKAVRGGAAARVKARGWRLKDGRPVRRGQERVARRIGRSCTLGRPLRRRQGAGSKPRRHGLVRAGRGGRKLVRPALMRDLVRSLMRL